ncbi:hypothetical protein [Streptomyces antimicrobicus]|uniref:Uncharacterized protein n=1 Tax=Streptomyces antimicrobicus TaxID=2883108 RepID=A0ABS8B755_9ACTN|nr:hypothetical protein [Streptomyces antimicrobicus]MCB5180391.1 hypothetical protein [Streptomyces antimicrobicus]
MNELLAAFDSDSEASLQAKNALLSGAPFEIWLDPLPASRLRGILRGRVRSLQRRGKSVVGVTECLARLAEKGEQGLLVAYVDDRERGGYLFPLYLDPQPLKVVGCIGFGSSPEGDPIAGPE